MIKIHNLTIRLQIILILLIFLSPILYLLNKRYQPQLALFRFDQERLSHTSSYPQLSWLTTSGKNVIDSSDKPIILRGVNLASTTWGEEYTTWNPLAIHHVAQDWQINVIRTRIHQYEYENSSAQFFLNLETQILEPARQEGLYIILHPWFGENQSLPDKQGIEMWLTVAKRYANDSHVLYDLLAEPRDVENHIIRESYQELIPQLREVNPNSLIFVTGSDWGREINSYLDNPLPFPNIVYRTNPYNKTGEFEGLFGEIAKELPVFIGEFGTEDKLTMQEQDIQDLLGYADLLQIGWTAWHYSSTGCPCLLTDNNTFTPSQYGQIVESALSDTTYPYASPIFPSNPNRLYLYSDFLHYGFSDYSWLTNINLQNTDSIYRGTSSLKGVINNSGGIYLHTSRSITSSNYSSFQLTIQSSLTDNLFLRFRTPQDELSDPIAISNFALNLDNWTLITIPTSMITTPIINGFTLESNTPITSPTPIYLDEIFFSN